MLFEVPHSFYVSSTAPKEEVRDQLARNGLNNYFIGVYGSHTPKAIALAEISRQHANKAVVFFGDSLGDLSAARETGVAFVGVTNERDNFKGLDIVKLEDFGSPERVDHALGAAIRIQRPSTRSWLTAVKLCKPPDTCITASARNVAGKYVLWQ